MPIRRLSAQPVHHVHLKQGHPPVSLSDLALMLEIDLIVMDDKPSFRRRLNGALRDAYRQGRFAARRA